MFGGYSDHGGYLNDTHTFNVKEGEFERLECTKITKFFPCGMQVQSNFKTKQAYAVNFFDHKEIVYFADLDWHEI